jgi:HlyD family secretion protein
MHPSSPTRVLIALALAAASAGACARKPAEAVAEQKLTVTVAPVAIRPLAAGLSANGVLVSREEAGVAAELSGYRVAQVLVDEGADVKAGQLLARLDDTLIRSQIDQQAANLALAKVAAEKAEAEAKRVEGLDNAGVLSQEAISERRLAAQSAQASVGVAQAQLNDLKTRQSRMSILAPVSGRVLERTARPGDTSAPGTTLFRIARDGLVELDAEIPEGSLAGLKIGDHAAVELASGAKVDGTVRFISPRVDQQTKLGRARIALPVRPDLRPGGFARAVFQATARPVPTVPESALRFDAAGASVMTVAQDGKVARTLVRTGQRAGGYVELVQGPPVGARVALGGSAFVSEGDKVDAVLAPGGPSA